MSLCENKVSGKIRENLAVSEENWNSKYSLHKFEEERIKCTKVPDHAA